MWLDFALALFCVAALLTVAWGFKGRLLTPVRKGENTDITVFIEVSGVEPVLEQTLKGLVWMSENGTLIAPVKLLVSDCDESTRHIAEAYAIKNKNITVCDVGEDKWTNFRNLTE